MAKKLMLEDPSYRLSKKFQFDHVWPILKDAEKWTNIVVSEHAKPRRRKKSLEGGEASSCASKSSGTPSFHVDLNADADEQEYVNEELSSYRPLGTKKAKNKRKEENEKKKIAEQILEDNQRLKEMVEKNMSERALLSAKHDQYVARKLELQRQREDDKIMLTNLDSIPDPIDRQFIQMRKKEIWERRARESQQQSSGTFGYGSFTNLLNPGGRQSTYEGTSGYGGMPHYGGMSHGGGNNEGFGHGESGNGTSDGYGRPN